MDCLSSSIKGIVILIWLFFRIFLVNSFAADEISEKITLNEFIDIAQKKVVDYGSYKVKIRLSATGEDKKQNMILWYSNGKVKITQLGPYLKDAVVVIYKNKEKTIRGHLGGLLSFITIPLSHNSSWLIGITGDTAHYSDFKSILNAGDLIIKNRLKNYKISLESDRFIIEAKIDKIGIDLDFVKNEDEYRFTFDKKTLSLLTLQRFDDGKLLNTVEWYELETNLDLMDDIFEI